MSSTSEVLEQFAAMWASFLEQLQANLATSTGTVRDTGARPIPLRPSTDTKISQSPGALVGYSLRETTGAAGALLYLLDATSSATASGATILAVISLAPGESTRDWFGDSGVGFSAGVYAQLTSGAVEGSVFLRGVE